jgi:hypothetical protein
MNIGKILAVSAVAGMVLGTVACGGDKPAAADPTSQTGDKKSCSGDKKSCTGSATPAMPSAAPSAAPAGH